MKAQATTITTAKNKQKPIVTTHHWEHTMRLRWWWVPFTLTIPTYINDQLFKEETKMLSADEHSRTGAGQCSPARLLTFVLWITVTLTLCHIRLGLNCVDKSTSTFTKSLLFFFSFYSLRCSKHKFTLKFRTQVFFWSIVQSLKNTFM